MKHGADTLWVVILQQTFIVESTLHWAFYNADYSLVIFWNYQRS